MAKVVGEIAVVVGSDVSKLQDGMRKGGKAVEGFDKRATKMAANFAKVGAAVAVAAAAAVAGITKMALSAGETAREINNLSAVAGTGVVEFQRYAAGAKNVGIEQEKLADIFKDVNDKFGDFMATGAGPLADFFDNIAPLVGVTAEQFARLSGPEALQLYVSSLERAGVTQQQMTFYMEALASDTTALVPLLANGGRQMRQFGDEAQRAGRIMSEDMIENGVEMDRKLTELAETLRVKATAAILEYSDEIVAAADFITDELLPAMADFMTDIAAFAESMKPAVDMLVKFIGLARAAAGISVGPGAELSAEEAARRAPEFQSQPGENGGTNTGQFYVDENGNVQEYGSAPSIPGITAPEVKPVVPLVNRKGKKGGKKGGGSSKGPTREDLEDLQARFDEETEIVQRNYDEAMEKLREYREAKLGTEAEFNELEADIKKKHEEDLAKIEREAQQQRMQAFSGMFSDLASLMQSENKKLFKVGQAAAIAEAVVNGYSAAVSAWEKGMKIGGPPVAAAFTAASLAKTGALIAGISSASPTGSGGGAAAGGAAGGTVAPNMPEERRVAEFRFVGGNVLDPSAIVDAMNDAYDQGYRIRGVIG